MFHFKAYADASFDVFMYYKIEVLGGKEERYREPSEGGSHD